MAVCELTQGSHPVPGVFLNKHFLFSEISWRKTCLLRFDPRHQFCFTLCEVSWSEVTCLTAQNTAYKHTQLALLGSHQKLAVSQETTQHHSSSWLNWCQRNDTAASNTGQESFHSIFNAHPSKQTSHQQHIDPHEIKPGIACSFPQQYYHLCKAGLQEQQGRITNIWPGSVTADLKGRVKTHPMKFHSATAP